MFFFTTDSCQWLLLQVDIDLQVDIESREGGEEGKGCVFSHFLSLRPRVSCGSTHLPSVESRTGAVPLPSTMSVHIPHINLKVKGTV